MLEVVSLRADERWRGGEEDRDWGLGRGGGGNFQRWVEVGRCEVY